MLVWLLFIIAGAYPAQPMYFTDQASCERAGKRIHRSVPNSNYINYTCTQVRKAS